MIDLPVDAREEEPKSEDTMDVAEEARSKLQWR